MHLPASVLSWLKSVTAPILGWDPRPLGLRDTLPDQPRPTIPNLAPTVVAHEAGDHTSHAEPTAVGTCPK